MMKKGVNLNSKISQESNNNVLVNKDSIKNDPQISQHNYICNYMKPGLGENYIIK